jgi:hypothetical protein
MLTAPMDQLTFLIFFFFQSTTFKVMTGIGAAGALGFLFLRKPPVASEPQGDAALSTGSSLTFVLRTLKDKRFLILALIIVYSGVTQSFIPGTFPLLVSTEPSDLAYKLVSTSTLLPLFSSIFAGIHSFILSGFSSS